MCATKQNVTQHPANRMHANLAIAKLSLPNTRYSGKRRPRVLPE